MSTSRKYSPHAHTAVEFNVRARAHSTNINTVPAGPFHQMASDKKQTSNPQVDIVNVASARLRMRRKVRLDLIFLTGAIMPVEDLIQDLVLRAIKREIAEEGSKKEAVR